MDAGGRADPRRGFPLLFHPVSAHAGALGHDHLRHGAARRGRHENTHAHRRGREPDERGAQLFADLSAAYGQLPWPERAHLGRGLGRHRRRGSQRRGGRLRRRGHHARTLAARDGLAAGLFTPARSHGAAALPAGGDPQYAPALRFRPRLRGLCRDDQFSGRGGHRGAHRGQHGGIRVLHPRLRHDGRGRDADGQRHRRAG